MLNYLFLSVVVACAVMPIFAGTASSEKISSSKAVQDGTKENTELDTSLVNLTMETRPASGTGKPELLPRAKDAPKPPVNENLSKSGTADLRKSVRISGWGWMTFGRVENSSYDRIRHNRFNYEKEWMNNYEYGFIFQKKMTENAWAKIHINGCLCYSIPEEEAKEAKSQKKSLKTRLLEASQYYKFLDQEKLSADLRFGYWSHKYNPQSRNLGEYLFRSGPYPQYLISGFEIADKVKVAGLQLGLTLNNSFRQELFVRMETEFYPLFDFSLAYLVHYRPLSLLSLSAGVDGYRLVPADKKKTVPANDTLVFKRRLPDMFYTYYMDDKDTVKAGFGGWRAMARITLDPKWLFGPEIFGKEDLKIYAEAALLGFKNYPTWHKNISHRIPVMAGFNIPAFKLLDVLALEVEYFASPYANSMHNIYDKRTPIPYIGPPVPQGPGFDVYANKRRDNWKWSLYASRKLGPFFRISAQVANDHSSRHQGNMEDITQSPQEWYWMTRVMFYFQ